MEKSLEDELANIGAAQIADAVDNDLVKSLIYGYGATATNGEPGLFSTTTNATGWLTATGTTKTTSNTILLPVVPYTGTTIADWKYTNTATIPAPRYTMSITYTVDFGELRIDGLTLKEIMAIYETNMRSEGKTKLSDRQKAAAQVEWSSQLKAKKQQASEKRRHEVVIDMQSVEID